MSRLWPEPSRVFIGRDRVVLRAGGIDALVRGESPLHDDAIVAAVDRLLGEHLGRWRISKRLSVEFSTHFSWFAPLPWSNSVRTREEIMAFARVVLEDQGLTNGASWIVDGEYDRYAKNGIAYALPGALLESLLTLLVVHRIDRPELVSANVELFRRRHRLKLAKRAWMLLIDGHRLDLQTYEDANLCTVDFESATAKTLQPLRRLLARAACGGSPPQQLLMVNSVGLTDVSEHAAIAQCAEILDPSVCRFEWKTK